MRCDDRSWLHSIRRIDCETKTVTTVGGNGHDGDIDEESGGAALASSIDRPDILSFDRMTPIHETALFFLTGGGHLRRLQLSVSAADIMKHCIDQCNERTK